MLVVAGTLLGLLEYFTSLKASAHCFDTVEPQKIVIQYNSVQVGQMSELSDIK